MLCAQGSTSPASWRLSPCFSGGCFFFDSGVGKLLFPLLSTLPCSVCPWPSSCGYIFASMNVCLNSKEVRAERERFLVVGFLFISIVLWGEGGEREISPIKSKSLQTIHNINPNETQPSQKFGLNPIPKLNYSALYCTYSVWSTTEPDQIEILFRLTLF